MTDIIKITKCFTKNWKRILLLFLLLNLHQTSAVIQCAIISKPLGKLKYKVRKIDCEPGTHLIPFSQTISFTSTNTISTTEDVKTGSAVYFEYTNEEFFKLKKSEIQNRRKIRGAPLIIGAWTLYLAVATMTVMLGIGINSGVSNYYKPYRVLQIPPTQLDNSYEEIIAKKDAEFKFNQSLIVINHSINLEGLRLGLITTPSHKNTPVKKKPVCQKKKATTSTSQSQTKTDNSKSVSQGQGGRPPPTRPPNITKRPPLPALVINIDDEEDDDVMEITNDSSSPNEPLSSSPDFEDDIQYIETTEVEISEQNEIHVELPVNAAFLALQCQPSTSTGIYEQATSAAPSRASSVHTVISLASTLSQASIGNSIPEVTLAIPVSRPNPGQLTSPLPRIPVIPSADHWNGLEWGTRESRITDTCNHDSFLSHCIYLQRSDPSYFARNLNLINSNTENTIKSIVTMYRRQNANSGTLSLHAHNAWRNLLISDPRNQGLYQPDRSNVISMAGSASTTVVRPLQDSSLLWFLHQCRCPRDSADLVEQDTFSAEDLRKINDNTYDSKKSTKKCKKCGELFNSNNRPLVAPTTWVHHFHTHPDNQDIHAYPRSLTFTDITTGDPVFFELGFITFTSAVTTTLRHQTSVHLIGGVNGIFRYYNGMTKFGELQDIPSDIKSSKYEMTYVVYFRK